MNKITRPVYHLLKSKNMQLSERANERVQEMDDIAVLQRCQQGDAQAFGQIVHKYMKPAYYTALGFTGNHEDALDLSQEAFVRAYRALGSFDLRQRFFTWFYKILRNLCLNHLRDHAKMRRMRPTPDPFHSEEFAVSVAGAGLDPSALAEQNERIAQLWKAMSVLKPEEREILLLREIEGCSYAEIAERLEIPTGTVMSRLFHARQSLKTQFTRLSS